MLFFTTPIMPNKVSPYYSECDRDLHSFFKSKVINSRGDILCQNCGKDIINWSLLHSRDTLRIEEIINEIKKEWWRDYWWRIDFDEKSLNKIRKRKNTDLKILIKKRIYSSVGRVYNFNGQFKPYRDGFQTPYAGNVIYYAQHALGICCRTCIEYIHGIPKGRELTEKETEYLTILILNYLHKRISSIA